jgi:hypothetical protein
MPDREEAAGRLGSYLPHRLGRLESMEGPLGASRNPPGLRCRPGKREGRVRNLRRDLADERYGEEVAR